MTESNVNYKGSITIDPVLMEAAGFLPFERVEVNNSSNGSRITTYVIPGEKGSGCVKMNGGAALHAKVGDKVHVLSYCELSKWKSRFYKPIVIVTIFDYRVNANLILSNIANKSGTKQLKKWKCLIPFFGLYYMLYNAFSLKYSKKMDELFNVVIGVCIIYLYHPAIIALILLKATGKI